VARGGRGAVWGGGRGGGWGLYSMPCECGEVCIGQTSRSIETRIKEYHQHIRLGHSDESSVAEYGFNTWLIIWGPSSNIPETFSA
jgi:hypothetical protein